MVRHVHCVRLFEFRNPVQSRQRASFPLPHCAVDCVLKDEETTRILVRRLFTFAARTTVVGDGYRGLSPRRLYVRHEATQYHNMASSCISNWPDAATQ